MEYPDVSRLKKKEQSDHGYVFVNGGGQPFNKSAWTSRLQAIFAHRNDGQRISPNIPRDSFVTYAYSRGISADLKASIARFMGHSVETAERVYNRSTEQERRLAGIQYVGALAEGMRCEPAHSEEAGDEPDAGCVGGSGEDSYGASEAADNDVAQQRGQATGAEELSHQRTRVR